MMPNDPGLSGDTCIFMEAIPGDGGNQNPADVWWLSPDITLTGHSSGLENADAGPNKILVRFHRKPAGTCNFPADESITVQAWVANPSLVMARNVHGSAARVGFIGSPVPAEGGSLTQQIDWTPPAVLLSPPGLENPQKPGPKCLMALCYPDSLTPSETKFFVPGDQHIAQHNLSVVSTTDAKVTFKINTFNPSPPPAALVAPVGVKLRAAMDLAPTAFVKKMVLTRLNPLPGFQQLKTAPLPLGFGFDLTGLQATQVVDNSHPPAVISPQPHPPSFEAMVQLPATLTQITFGVNLKGAQSGEACIFHLTQTFKDVPQGGLTLVLLKL
jgi:hypothetical protein